MKRGLFISFEGGDGSGKSTQISRAKSFLESRGIDVILTREPGGTAIGEKIRELILDRENSEMDDMAEALLYAASRAQHVSQVIRPAVENGTTVICDRYVDSSIAYQGFGRNLGEAVEVINSYAIREYIPDITFFLKLDPEVGRGRLMKGTEDRLELEKLEFHQKVYNGYIEIEKKHPDRFIGIDASRSIEEISEEIIGHLERLIDEY